MNSITDNFYFRMEINQATKPKLESTNKNKNRKITGRFINYDGEILLISDIYCAMYCTAYC